jgi:HEAT repeat protein
MKKILKRLVPTAVMITSFEAIKCLLKAGDNYGVKAIRKYMQDESTDLVNKAIMLAGAYKVKDLVPELIQMLKKKSLSGNDFEAKIPVVKALGLINDPRAVDALKGMLSARSFLYKGALENLKGEIKKSLKNYSRKDS